MASLKDIKTQFIRIYEGIAERRGLSNLFGRIMAIFFLESKDLSQKQLSDLTGYSISSVSRTLDQMIQMGVITKFKNPTREYYLYHMKINYIEMAIGGLKTWIIQAESGKNEIKKLRTIIENDVFNNKDVQEANRLITLFKGFEDDIDTIVKTLNMTIKEVLNSS